MLVKGMQQIAQIEFENCILFLVSERKLPLRHPIFNGQRFIKVLAKISKQERWEELETW